MIGLFVGISVLFRKGHEKMKGKKDRICNKSVIRMLFHLTIKNDFLDRDLTEINWDLEVKGNIDIILKDGHNAHNDRNISLLGLHTKI